jgi:hypothetical protein
VHKISIFHEILNPTLNPTNKPQQALRGKKNEFLRSHQLLSWSVNYSRLMKLKARCLIHKKQPLGNINSQAASVV